MALQKSQVMNVRDTLVGQGTKPFYVRDGDVICGSSDDVLIRFRKRSWTARKRRYGLVSFVCLRR